MARAKRGFKRRKRVQKLKKQAEGFVHGLRTQFKRMAEAVDRKHVYGYRDRRNKKRDFRGLWITRVGIASSAQGISYSRLISALKKSEVIINRKMLADIAVHDPNGFAALVSQVKSAAPAH